MGWLASILVGLFAAGAGLFAAGFVMNACVGWYRVSSFEGKAGYAVVTVALLGAIAGLVLGIVVARMAPSGGFVGFARSVGIAWGILGAMALMSAAVARALADIPPTLEGRELMLEVEVRLPEDAKEPARNAADTSYFHLHSVVRGVARKSWMGNLRPTEARLEDGRWVVPGSVRLFTQRGRHSLGFVIGDQPPFGFIVPLPARPKRAHEAWSEWGPRPHPPNAWPDTKPSYRFRVRRIDEEGTPA